MQKIQKALTVLLLDCLIISKAPRAYRKDKRGGKALKVMLDELITWILKLMSSETQPSERQRLLIDSRVYEAEKGEKPNGKE